MKAQLWIGNRNYSSWSLRAWLCLKWAGVDFSETRIDLDQPGYGERRIAQVLAVSPSGMVPVLKLGSETIWDTMAIAEWAAETAPELLPSEHLARAAMRAAAGEMHAGFAALRSELPMNIRRRCKAEGLSGSARADVERIDRLWATLRERYAAAGAFLFGKRSIADAFYLPVATRFRTYGVALSAPAQAYADALLRDADFLVWERAALAEDPKPFSRARIDSLYTVAEPGRSSRVG
jgi:glutathione S-transferase